MAEMTYLGKAHGDAMLISGGDDSVIADRTDWLNDTAYAYCRHSVDTVAERKQGVKGHHRSLDVKTIVHHLDAGNFCRVNAALLPGADT